jgi:hypothetical protein
MFVAWLYSGAGAVRRMGMAYAERLFIMPVVFVTEWSGILAQGHRRAAPATWYRLSVSADAPFARSRAVSDKRTQVCSTPASQWDGTGPSRCAHPSR